MNRVILIKYGELTTKKGNRNFFVKTLKKNVEHKLKKYNVNIVCDMARMYIYFEEDDLKDITDIINRIFGIHMYHIAIIADTNVDNIMDECLKALSTYSFKTFKVETKRSYKNSKWK